MSSQLIASVIFLVVFCLLLIVAQGMYKFLKLEAEVSRKFMHVSGGIVSLFFPYFFKVHWWVLLLCCIAFLVLLITYIKKSLPGIHKTNRLSFGSIFFPVPVYICFFAANNLIAIFYSFCLYLFLLFRIRLPNGEVKDGAVFQGLFFKAKKLWQVQFVLPSVAFLLPL